MDSISIKLEFGSTHLDMSFEPTKENVVALFAFINAQMGMADDDPRSAVISGLSSRLKTTTDKLEGEVASKGK